MRTITILVRVLLVIVVLAACSGNVGTPGPSSGPAFGVVAPLRTERREDQICVRQRLKNYGNRTGGGQCVLHGYWRNTASPGADVDGPTVPIPAIAPEEAITLRAHWRGPVPDAGLYFVCEPGLRM